MSPDHGLPVGGVPVDVEGGGFTPGATVHFGSATATHVVVRSKTR